MGLENKFELMKKQGIVEGSRIELTLFKGVEYDHYSGPAGACDPTGYEPTETMTKESGLMLTAYVYKFSEENEKYRAIMLISVMENNGVRNLDHSSWYVREECIHSFRK